MKFIRTIKREQMPHVPTDYCYLRPMPFKKFGATEFFRRFEAYPFVIGFVTGYEKPEMRFEEHNEVVFDEVVTVTGDNGDMLVSVFYGSRAMFTKRYKRYLVQRIKANGVLKDARLQAYGKSLIWR